MEILFSYTVYGSRISLRTSKEELLKEGLLEAFTKADFEFCTDVADVGFGGMEVLLRKKIRTMKKKGTNLSLSFKDEYVGLCIRALEIFGKTNENDDKGKEVLAIVTEINKNELDVSNIH